MLPHEWIAQNGVLLVFLNVLGASLGLPLPVMPTLIAVAACQTQGAASLWSIALPLSPILGVAVLAGVLADLIWFFWGRRYGPRTLNTVCDLTLSREACVSKTEQIFGQWGARLLIVARVLPGLSLVAVPLCGAMGVRLRTFVGYDCAGVTLWIGAGLTLGVMFASQIQRLLNALSVFGARAMIAIGVLAVVCVAYRFARRIWTARASDNDASLQIDSRI
ncbi:hypothetical protein PI93_002905 [Pandoraea fibrosis]|uniref:VTT domain-containing protein n=1 Tax=Pandoraea fibrosis TaxID=1891094 RepID=A0ABX6HM65_9BURK|nr:DedA family protein [Pandoraea fibrosis]QHE90886.1 hypothetical protein PJ20_002905 [Pandoraea fibrosis]QHF11717.1 hypothetical protein PI93_002905 [Pandoraea fibrosis]